MIKLYTTEVIGVDIYDYDRPVFKLHVYDESCATLTINTIVTPDNIALLCDAIQQAMERLELEGDVYH